MFSLWEHLVISSTYNTANVQNMPVFWHCLKSQGSFILKGTLSSVGFQTETFSESLWGRMGRRPIPFCVRRGEVRPPLSGLPMFKATLWSQPWRKHIHREGRAGIAILCHCHPVHLTAVTSSAHFGAFLVVLRMQIFFHRSCRIFHFFIDVTESLSSVWGIFGPVMNFACPLPYSPIHHSAWPSWWFGWSAKGGGV